MIKKNKIKKNDLIFIYKRPIEESTIGLVTELDYPIMSILVYSDNKTKTKKIDISENNFSLTILDENKINDCFSPTEQKKIKILKKITTIPKIVDLFEGTY